MRSDVIDVVHWDLQYRTVRGIGVSIRTHIKDVGDVWWKCCDIGEAREI